MIRESVDGAATGQSDAETAAVLVVIPTYNEKDNLGPLIDEILALGDRYRVLVVDDNSPDGTGVLADDLATACSTRVRVLHRAHKEGLGRAYVAGLGEALSLGSPLVAQMDADHSHRPEDLARLVSRLGDADVAIGSRYVPGGQTIGWPWHRKLISRLGGLYAGLVLGVPIRDLTGGFKVWRRQTLATIDLTSIHSDGYCFQIETTYRALRAGCAVVQVPITFHDRIAGKSKLSRRVVIEAALMVWRLRWRQLTGKRW